MHIILLYDYHNHHHHLNIYIQYLIIIIIIPFYKLTILYVHIGNSLDSS